MNVYFCIWNLTNKPSIYHCKRYYNCKLYISCVTLGIKNAPLLKAKVHGFPECDQTDVSDLPCAGNDHASVAFCAVQFCALMICTVLHEIHLPFLFSSIIPHFFSLSSNFRNKISSSAVEKQQSVTEKQVFLKMQGKR